MLIVNPGNWNPFWIGRAEGATIFSLKSATNPAINCAVNRPPFRCATALFVCSAIALSACLEAATITVTSTGDSGSGSLRAALASANNGDTIVFSLPLPTTITLTTGELLVSNSVVISGPGANNLAVNGNAASRVFHVGSNSIVTISGLTITNGRPSLVSGGGIWNDHAMLTISNTALSGNSAGATNYGGGVYNDGRAGGVNLRIVNSTLGGNTARYGGGIYGDNRDGGATALQIVNSTLSSNTAVSLGGGIYYPGTASLLNSTLNGNSAGVLAGSIFNPGGSILQIGGTILNPGASGGNIYNEGMVTSRGYNLSSDAAGGDGTTGPGGLLNATGDIRNTDPILGPLQDNGGPTATHALLAGSPAIDRGTNFSGSATDQRGAPRTSVFPSISKPNGGDGTDIGAFELGGPHLTVRKASTNVVLSWPTSAGTNFALQSKTNLAATATNWVTVPGTPSLVDGWYTVTNSPTETANIFRLKGN
jgi:hypothetical protein